VLAQLAAAPSGLLVVGSDPQTLVSAALTEEEYVQTLRLLEYVGNLIVTDVGAGLQQPFLPAALAGCDQLVVASAATWDAAQSAGAALDWLAARGFGRLVERSIVVVNNLYPARRRRSAYIRDIKADLARRAGAVHEIPFDAALQPGGRILLRKLSASARQAYLEVAADLVAGLATAR
jgi:MinD-like ATPase involved in chromosome partitioning or flagellar assembly